MKNKGILIQFILQLFLFLPVSIYCFSGSADTANVLRPSGAYYSGTYHNLFSELLNKSEKEVKTKIDTAFMKLFYGDNKTERVYYPVENGMAYIEDINNKDVRTEGMSYGMMIAVQMNKKNEFDRLWKWAKTFMQHDTGESKNYFAWHCNTDGSVIESNSASDGEEWFVMSLLFASARWGNGEGINSYKNEAQAILDAMLHKEEQPGNTGKVKNMFNKKEEQVVFVPNADASGITDPSYHLPHYYELWGRWADRDNSFWCSAASKSRRFLKKAVNPETGLAPDYANFDGTPAGPWYSGSKDFRYDAWRVAMNVAVDYAWFAKEDWEVEQSNRLLNFFYAQGIGKYGHLFTLDGKPLTDNHSVGHAAMNAVASLASTNENRRDFLEELWNIKVPSGQYRYYDGLLYMLAMLQVSGNFRIYNMPGSSDKSCSDL